MIERIKKNVHQVSLLFAVLGVIFIPFSFYIIPFQQKISAFVFTDIVTLLAEKWRFLPMTNSEFTSDSTTSYWLLFCLFIIAISLNYLFSVAKIWMKKGDVLIKYFQLILSFYLSIILFKYGLDKITGIQFYAPDPNILFTPLGFLDKDILFWSAIGASRSYQIFLGIAEIIPALLLLHYRTRNIGLLLSLVVFTNIFFVNLTFDISVKLFSAFLLFVTILLLTPICRSLYNLFFLQKSVPVPTFKIPSSSINKKVLFCSRGILLSLFFFEIIYPLTIVKKESQSPLIGAYTVISAEQASDSTSIKRVFIHKENYLIFQYQDDTTEDFYFKKDEHSFEVYTYEGNHFTVDFEFDGTLLKLNAPTLNWNLLCKVIPLESLPLNQKLFHWSVDSIE